MALRNVAREEAELKIEMYAYKPLDLKPNRIFLDSAYTQVWHLPFVFSLRLVFFFSASEPHFPSFGSSFWEPESVILGPWGGPWHLQQTNPEKDLKKEANPHRSTSI